MGFKRRLAQSVVGCLVGVACGFVAIWLISPQEHLPDDKLRVYLSKSCGKSMRLRKQLEEDPRLLREIVPIPLDDADTPLSREICGIAIDEIRRQAFWLSAFSDDWMCSELVEHAVEVFDRNFSAIPAWSDGDRPLRLGANEAALLRHDLVYGPGFALTFVGEQATEEENPTPPVVRPINRSSERGFPIGL